MRRRSIHVVGRILLALVAMAGLFAPRAAGQADAEAAEEASKVTVSVQVLRPDGTPLAEAEVKYRLISNAGSKPREGDLSAFGGTRHTDAEGRFTLHEEVRGRCFLGVRADSVGYAVSEAFQAPEGDEPQSVVLKLAAGIRVSGRVTDAKSGEPVAEAYVSAESQSEEAQYWIPQAKTRSAADGTWTLEHVPPGRYRFRAYDGKGDYLRDSAPLSSVSPDVDESLGIPITMTRAARLHGLIVHADGTPVAEAEVTVTWERLRGDDQAEYISNQKLKTDAEGKFGIPRQAGGRYRFRILADGHGYGSSEPFDVPEGGHSERIQITLSPGAALAGVCVDKATGKPLAGAWVRLSSRNVPDQRISLPTLTSDEQGRWQWNVVPPGRWELQAGRDEYQNAETTVDVAADAAPEEVRLELQPFASVRGTVVAADGKTPVAGARLRLTWSRKEVATGADGCFGMTLPNMSRVPITITAEGYTRHEITLDATSLDPAKELTIVLSARGGTVRGRVVNQDTGKPLADQEVYLIPSDENGPFGWIVRDDGFWRRDPDTFRHFGGAEKIVSAKTDAQGLYAAEHVSAGKVMAVVCPAGGITARSPEVEVTEGGAVDADVSVTSRPLGFVIVHMVRPDGTPLAEADLWYDVSWSERWGRSSRSGSDPTTSDGRALFRIRQAGAMEMTLAADGYRTIHHTFELPDTKLTVEAEFRLVAEKADAVISGRVFLPDGKTPAAGVYVSPFVVDQPVAFCYSSMSRNGKRYSFLSPGAPTGEDGSFRVENLRPGAYGIYVSPWKELWGERGAVRDELKDVVPVTTDSVEVVESGQVGGVVAVLKQGGVLQGKVVDAKSGKPIAEARIDPDWDTYRGMFGHRVDPPDLMFDGGNVTTDAEGCFRIVLPPGQYTLRVWANGYGHKRFDGWKAVKILAGATVERTIQLEAQ